VKILVAIDDSPYSQKVVEKIARRHWPPDSEFKILTVVEPVSLDELAQKDWLDVVAEVATRRLEHANHLCDKARKLLESQVADCTVHYEVRKGSPKAEIIDVAAQWSADKIVMGAHGRGVCPHFRLGSVSLTVAQHAHCSVEIIRPRITARDEEAHAASCAEVGKT